MGYYDCDDYFDGPSEFERQIDEFKASLVKAVKREHQDELDELRAENAELQDVKSRMEEIEREHRANTSELKRLVEEAKREAKRMRLSELMDDRKFVMYRPVCKQNARPRCSKCNERRQIEYTTPLGRKASEYCTCNSYERVYKSSEWTAYKFYWYKSAYGKSDRLSVVYAMKSMKSCDGEEFKQADDYDGDFHKSYKPEMKFEELEPRKIFFEHPEDCERYCEWLNEKEEARIREGT